MAFTSVIPEEVGTRRISIFMKKIKGNLRFEKGVKQIECDIPKQTVTITYDAEKTNPEAIMQSFGKFGYKATEVKKPADKKPADKK